MKVNVFKQSKCGICTIFNIHFHLTRFNPVCYSKIKLFSNNVNLHLTQSGVGLKLVWVLSSHLCLTGLKILIFQTWAAVWCIKESYFCASVIF